MRTVLCFISLALCFVCCRQEVLLDTAGGHNSEKSTVTLSLNVLKEDDGSLSKAVVDDEGASSIKNILVIQYSGTGDASFLEGDVSYLTSSDFSVSGSVLNANVRLVSGDQPSTVFFIANSFDKGFVPPQTLGEMKNLYRPVINSNECLGYDGSSWYPMLTGWCVLPSVHSSTVVSATLSRNVAKFTLHIVNSTHNIAAKLSVKSISLESVPDRSYYFPDYSSPSLFPASGSFSTRTLPLVEWPGEIVQGEAEVSADFVFYLPVNKRGTVENDDDATKNKYAIADASYAVINCECYDPDGGLWIPVSYKIYLGENMHNDFNLAANRSYTFNIKLKSKGNSSTDSRITDYGPVDFSAASRERSNCYILNPPITDDYWRTFIIPVDKVDAFWGYGYSSSSAPYEYLTNYQLSPSKPWKVEVIWSDFTIDNSVNFRFAGANPASYSGSGADAFKVQVPKGVKGNVLIGIRRTDVASSPYLWSWHLWITDYSPDEVTKFHIPSDSVIEYVVTGGKCCRPDWTNWKEGKLYARSFIMDRNVGALDPYHHTWNQSGVFYYQFGRKDPLWANDKGRSTVTLSSIISSSDPTATIKYAVLNPRNIIVTDGENWTGTNKYNPGSTVADILWHDPCATTSNHKKSFFDPCPEGWMVPEEKAFYQSSSSMSRLSDGNNNGWGHKGSMILQFTGWMNGHDRGNVNASSSEGEYWMSNHRVQQNRAAAVEFSSSYSSDNGSVKSDASHHGFAVRCVSEPY